MNEDLAARMRILTEQFVARSISRRDALAAALERLALAGAAAEARADIMHLAHGLAGTASLFGFDEIGRLAGRIDDDCRDSSISDESIAAMCGELIALLGAVPDQRR